MTQVPPSTLVGGSVTRTSASLLIDPTEEYERTRRVPLAHSWYLRIVRRHSCTSLNPELCCIQCTRLVVEGIPTFQMFRAVQ